VIILALATVYVLTGKHSSTVTLISIAFVVGGGIGNIYDRLIHGSVTDFLHLDFGLFQTGIFNMADVSIMAGMDAILINAFVTQSRFAFKISDNKLGVMCIIAAIEILISHGLPTVRLNLCIANNNRIKYSTPHIHFFASYQEGLHIRRAILAT